MTRIPTPPNDADSFFVISLTTRMDRMSAPNMTNNFMIQSPFHMHRIKELVSTLVVPQRNHREQPKVADRPLVQVSPRRR
jgi:hypothetical protein